MGGKTVLGAAAPQPGIFMSSLLQAPIAGHLEPCSFVTPYCARPDLTYTWRSSDVEPVNNPALGFWGGP